MKILVIGSGAVGGFYGIHLASAGHEVAFVARGENGRAIRQHGFVLEKPSATLSARPRVFEDVSAAADFQADVALVAVKAGALDDVASGTGATLAPGGVAVPLLNGLDSEERLSAAIGRERVIGAIAQVAAELAEPGRVRARSEGGIVLAPLVPAQQALTARIAEDFARAGFSCRVVADLPRLLWTKLLWNAPFNAVCALTGLPAGRVLEVPELRALVTAAMKELLAVARAEGVVLEADLVDRTIAATARDFADCDPSMLQDVRAGRPTEADALQGAVVRAGARHAVPAPIHETLYALLKGLDSGRERR